MTKVARIGFIGDLHALSRYALVPPRFRPQADRPTSRFYGYVWECWEHFCKHCPPLDTLVVNGDSLEGETPTQRSPNDALTDSILDQADAAVDILKMIRPKVKRLWLLRGTPFHDQKHFEALELIGEKVKAEPWTDRRRTGEVLDLKWQGFGFNISHHQTGGWLYLAGGADRMALMACAAEAQGKTLKADVIVRSHLHQKRIVQAHSKWVILLPGWKLPNPYAVQKMEYMRAMESCDLGAVLMEVRNGQLVPDDTFTYRPFAAQYRS
jgi:hypothetical protein